MEGFGWYTFEIVKRLVLRNPEHEFIFFFDRAFDKKFLFAENITTVVINPPARHPVLFYLWFEFGVTRALKKHKADLFFSPDGYLSLRTKCKQVSVIHDINFEHNPEDLPRVMRKYLTRFFPKFANRADHIITVSNYSKRDIEATYGINPLKITAIWNGASEVFKPLSEEEKQLTREKYTKGSNYFLFVGALSPRKNVTRLIEAFVQYKSSVNNSNEKLLIVGSSLFLDDSKNIIPEEIKSQIVFTGHLPIEELALIMGSASIFTFIPYFEGFGIPLVEAMRCGTPILAANKTSLPEVAEEAALYCDPFDTNDVFEKLKQLAMSSALQKHYSEKGLERSKLFSWDYAAKEVWDVIKKQLNEK